MNPEEIKKIADDFTARVLSMEQLVAEHVELVDENTRLRLDLNKALSLNRTCCFCGFKVASLEGLKAHSAECPDHPLMKKAKDLETEYFSLKAIKDELLGKCHNDECSECGKTACPFRCELHFHHDGCPVCANATPAELEQAIRQAQNL